MARFVPFSDQNINLINFYTLFNLKRHAQWKVL